MAKFKGIRNSGGAIFIYMDEWAHNDALWNDGLREIADKDPIHIELVTQKQEFLDSLKLWNQAQDFIPQESDVGDNRYTPAMLLIDAHMGPSGVAPVPDDQSRIITWKELTAAIEKPLSVIWLFGCDSDLAKPHFIGKTEILLTCSAKENFAELVPEFRNEVSSVPVVYFDQMLQKLRQKIPSLSYFVYDGKNWNQSFETKSAGP